MPSLNVVLPASLETTLKAAATDRGIPIESLVNAALGEYLQTTSHRIYQISTASALVEGVDRGAISSRTLLEHGDFGIGTFEDMDGEMVLLDGSIYQIRGDGSVRNRRDDFQVPFAVVCRFQEEEAFNAAAIGGLKDLESACDRRRESENLFYALRADGVFEQVRARAVNASAEGGRLIDAAKKQTEFNFENIEGSLVCFWSPRYSRAFSVPGYHFHFLSKDRAKGGHLLDCSAGTLRVGIQTLYEYDVRLPTAGPFLTANLNKDPGLDLEQAEH